ncbi:MAG: ABC transporter ATP-binding protein [Clostridia bacterium]|nr:ABC transporter ATP-binding protein [Clostridia bacterium]
MKKEQKKIKQKEKKPRLKLSRVLSDNLFVLRIVHRAAPWYMPTYFGWSVFASLVNFLSGSYLLRVAVNKLQTPTEEALRRVILYIVVVFVLNLTQRLVTGWINNRLYPKYNLQIVGEFQELLFAKARRVELECYEDPAFYDKYVKVMDNAYNRSMNVVYALDRLIWNAVSFCANAALLFVIDPIFIVFGLIPFVLGLLNKRANKLHHTLTTEVTPSERKQSYIRRAFYMVDYAKEMRLTNMYRQLFELQHEAYREHMKALRRYSLHRVPIAYVLNIGLEVVTILGAILYAAYQTLNTGRMLLGDCLVVFNSVATISWTLNDLIANLAEFHANALYIEDFRYFLDYQPKIDANEQGLQAEGGTLSLRGVSFCYRGATQSSLKGIDLDFHPGEKIALVGCNGSGKTTLTKLLLHLYEPTEGQVLLNGIPATAYSQTSWRRQFGVVFQDLKTFSMSVAENVLMRPIEEDDEARVIEALKQSGGWEKISSLPHGIHTTLTREFDDEGVVLSGGESQKVALARIFAVPTPIVILDEPSSALDPIAEYTMFDNMLRACRDRTLIFISHRLSSAVLADRVILLDHGEIVESGSHKELMERNGIYAEMFRKQAENYVDTAADGEVSV